uniref:Uncharacterized protein n=1 Tax=viral metagenome TaxID=1070528 RepID=A0A6C0JEN3_9ZZZZ
MVCFLSTIIWCKNGFCNRCAWCNISDWSVEDGNYIVKFYGKGKYNGKYMCLDCLRSKLTENNNSINH